MEKLAEVADEAERLRRSGHRHPHPEEGVWAARSGFLTAIEADTKLIDGWTLSFPVDKIAQFPIGASARSARKSASISATSATPAMATCTFTAAPTTWRWTSSWTR